MEISMSWKPLSVNAGFRVTRHSGLRQCGFGAPSADGIGDFLNSRKTRFFLLTTQAFHLFQKDIGKFFDGTRVRALRSGCRRSSGGFHNHMLTLFEV
jgi:hypothetical protein